MKIHTNTFTGMITAVLCSLAMSLAGQAQAPLAADTSAFGYPLAKLTTGNPVYDFGDIEEGKIVTQVYTFTNTSDQVLVLSDAKGNCGCTVPAWPSNPIMPGETASFTVSFNSFGKTGLRNQRITITANTDPPQTFFYLTGRVIPRKSDAPDLPMETAPQEVASPNPDCFAIYPNPTAELLQLEIAQNSLGESAVVSIYAKTGQLMARREIAALDGPLTFNVGHYPPGMYLANVQIGARQPEVRCFIVTD